MSAADAVPFPRAPKVRSPLSVRAVIRESTANTADSFLKAEASVGILEIIGMEDIIK